MFQVLVKHQNCNILIGKKLGLLKDLTSTILNLFYGSQEKGRTKKETC